MDATEKKLFALDIVNGGNCRDQHPARHAKQTPGNGDGPHQPGNPGSRL